MIVAKMHGGLGNQMFEYAAARALAHRHQTGLALDLSHYTGEQRYEELKQFPRAYKLAAFNVKAQLATDADIARTRDRWRRNPAKHFLARVAAKMGLHLPLGIYSYWQANFDPGFASVPDNVYVEGYLQSEQYFSEVANLIREDFTFVDPKLTEYGKRYIDDQRRAGQPVVAVHVRRGDLAFDAAKQQEKKLTHGPPITADHVHAAMKLFDPASRFLLFSDSAKDLNWCKENIHAPNIAFAEGHNDLQDFAVMQNCDHFIISNSTFSWWAAWLSRKSDKRVIAPKNWFYEELFRGYRIRDLIPESWTLL
jgi:hypothetical protein